MTIITDTISFASLPSLGTEAFGGKFYGVTTLKDGTHAAVILLPNKAKNYMGWKAARAWAARAGGMLPSKTEAELLYAIARSEFKKSWHWVSNEERALADEENDTAWVWSLHFDDGIQGHGPKNDTCSARAVRLIPLTL